MRALRVLLIILVIFGGLFVAADRLAVNLAEDMAAEKIRGSQGLDRTPEVSIKGFPFLTQVLGRNLTEVDADLGGMSASAEGRTLRVEKLRAQFRDVRLTSDFSSIESAASATGSATISYADLTKAAGGGIRISYAGEKNGPRVKISPNLPLLSNVEVTGSLAVSGNTVRLRADEIPMMCKAIPTCQSKVRTQTDHVWTLDRLPGNLKLDEVVAKPDGISLSVSGKNVKIPS